MEKSSKTNTHTQTQCSMGQKKHDNINQTARTLNIFLGLQSRYERRIHILSI